MSHYKNIMLEAVENGYKLSYVECEKNGSGPFTNDIYRPKEYVYQDDKLDEAVEKIKYLKAENAKKKNKREYD